MGHDHRSCTNPKKMLISRKKEIAAVNPEESDVKGDFYKNSINAINNVSIAFCDSRIKCNRFMTFLSLFDTGSPINFMRKSFVPFNICDTATKSTCRGLGKKC